MNQNPAPTQPHPLSDVTMVKCATPRCQNGVRASKAVYCSTCLQKQQAANPESPETTRPRFTGGD